VDAAARRDRRGREDTVDAAVVAVVDEDGVDDTLLFRGGDEEAIINRPSSLVANDGIPSNTLTLVLVLLIFVECDIIKGFTPSTPSTVSKLVWLPMPNTFASVSPNE
jgi:hypothetical protein